MQMTIIDIWPGRSEGDLESTDRLTVGLLAAIANA